MGSRNVAGILLLVVIFMLQQILWMPLFMVAPMKLGDFYKASRYVVSHQGIRSVFKASGVAALFICV